MRPHPKLSVVAEPRPWPLHGPAEPSTVALIVIDMQVDFVCSGGWFGAMGFDLSSIQGVVPALARLLCMARRVTGLAVIHTRQGNAPDLSDLPHVKREQARLLGVPFGHAGPYGRGLIRGEPGWNFVKELEPIAGEEVVDKTGFSAFAGTGLDRWLRDRDIRSLVLTGVTANVCVLSSLYGAVDLGYDCLVVRDAIAGADQSAVSAVLDLVRYQRGLLGTIGTSHDTVRALEAMGTGDPASAVIPRG